MSPITKTVYANLRRSLEWTLQRNQDTLLTKKVPVNYVVAREIGMKIDPKVVSAFNSLPSGTDAHTMLMLLDYANAMEAYGKKRWDIPGLDGMNEGPASNEADEDKQLPEMEIEDNE